jgi:hypothetical protein
MEQPKRLAPTKETLRRLYVLSGNQCAFPGCEKPLFNHEGNFVAQICHIEAAMPDGERFNKYMSNEERRSFGNLLLLCYPHHIETNKINIYSTEKLKKIKSDHEIIFSDIDDAVFKMASSIIDYAKLNKFNEVNSLANLFCNRYGIGSTSDEEMQLYVKDFNDGLKDLALLSNDARKYFSIALSRSRNESNIYGKSCGKIYFDQYEIDRVTRLHRNISNSLILEISNAGFIYFGEDSNDIEWPYFKFQNSECNFWEIILDFCKEKELNISDVVYDMKFSILE